MRYLLFLVVALVLTGCGASSATAVATATVAPQPVASATPATAGSQIQSYSHAPPMSINKNAQYHAVVATTDGRFTIQLLPRVAPITVNSFVFLARHHFFNGITFHRIVSNFMIQSGDPTGTGTGGPGYTFRDEPVRQKYTAGTVAMANHGANTNGSQFFIVVGNGGAGLAPSYTIFGRVSAGMNVVNAISRTPVGPNPGMNNEMSSPLKTIRITSVTILQG